MNDNDQNAATAEADRMYPSEPEEPTPTVLAGLLAGKIAWLRWWAAVTGTDVRPDIEYWKRFYGG